MFVCVFCLLQVMYQTPTPKSVNSDGTTANITMGESFYTSVLKFTRLTPHAYSPVRSTIFAAGFDLRSAYAYDVPPHDRCLVKTDLRFHIPDGCYGRIAPRSGLALHSFIDVGAGVIDQDYRGNVGVVIFNHAHETFKINQGDRIAQLICEKIEYPRLEETADIFEYTERGTNGFGSTGV